MISVIIPVYNAAKWLPQCLDSVLGQDYKDIEVILVNDASTDKSFSICRQYVAKDKRIILIDKKKNEGVESARQSGYVIAHGEYIMYIDSDDWLDHSQVLSRMYEKAEETRADYVTIGVRRVLDRHKWVAKKQKSHKYGLIEQPELHDLYKKAFFGANYLLSVNSLWDKLYRKSTIDKANIQPLGFVYYEDFMYNMQLSPYLSKIYVMDEFGYNYRYGGMSCHFNPYVFRDLKRIYNIREHTLKKDSSLSDDVLCSQIRIELKNVLKSEICQLIEFSGKSREAIIAYIETEIKRPLYDRMLEVNKDSVFWNDSFVIAFAAGDSSAMYDICQRQVSKEHPKRMVKHFLARILQSI